jgi:hypothetical protein
MPYTIHPGCSRYSDLFFLDSTGRSFIHIEIDSTFTQLRIRWAIQDARPLDSLLTGLLRLPGSEPFHIFITGCPGQLFGDSAL